MINTVFPINANAERSVGNGGGLGEMKALYLHQNLGSFLDYCLAHSAQCGMSAIEQQEFVSVLSEIKSATPNDLVVDPDLAAASIFTSDPQLGAPIRLSASALYRQSGGVDVPRSAAEIASYLLAAFWSHHSADSKTDLLARAARIMSGFQESSNDAVLISSPLLAIRQQTLRFGAEAQQVIFLEDRRTTINLTASLLEAPMCRRFENWRMVGGSSRNSVTILADVTSSCEGAMTFQILTIDLNLDSNSTVIESSLRAVLRESL